MSLQASRWAWAQSEALSATQKLVLLALADYANEAQTCWPTLAALADKTLLSRRAVINALARLIDLNLVTRLSRGPQRSPLYILAVRDEETSPERVHAVHGEVQEIHPPGARDAPPEVHEVHPILSREPIKEPSMLNAAPTPVETGKDLQNETQNPAIAASDAEHVSESPQEKFHRWIGLLEQTGFTRKSLANPAVLAGLRHWIDRGVGDDDIEDALFIAKARLHGELPASPAYLLKIMPGLRREKQQVDEEPPPVPVRPVNPTHGESKPHESHRRPSPVSAAERMRQVGLEYLRRRGLESESPYPVE